MLASFGSILIIVMAVVLAVSCLAIAVWQFRSSSPPANRAQRLSRSILVGFTITGGIFSMVTIAGALDVGFEWTGNTVAGIVCLAIPLQLMATIGAYIQFGYLPWMQRQLSKAAKGHSRMPDNSDARK